MKIVKERQKETETTRGDDVWFSGRVQNVSQ